jgi:hypothetical protein
MNSSSIFGDKCQRIKTFKGQVITRNVRFQRFTRTEQGVDSKKSINCLQSLMLNFLNH